METAVIPSRRFVDVKVGCCVLCALEWNHDLGKNCSLLSPVELAYAGPHKTSGAYCEGMTLTGGIRRVIAGG
jgi:hypothetical protein